MPPLPEKRRKHVGVPVDTPVEMTNVLTAAQVFAAAVDLREAKRMTEAEQLYRMVLASEPDHFDALHALGVLLR